MGMFDTVYAHNIRHDAFQHNGRSFQTKCLDMKLSEFIIFNNRLWREYDGEESNRYELAVDVNYHGEIDIYTHITSDGVERWIEYNLVFQQGELVSVSLVSNRITEDHRDMSLRRPMAPSDRLVVTIDASQLVEEKKDAFLERVEDCLDSVREAVGDSKATISYPAKVSGGVYSMCGPAVRNVFSVVQDMQSFKDAGEKVIPSPGGGQTKLIFDEYSTNNN